MTKLMKQPGYLYSAGPTHLVMTTERTLGRGDNTAASLLEDTLRDSGYPHLADLLKLADDTLQEPKQVLVVFDSDVGEITYLSTPYCDDVLALDNLYLGIDKLTNEQELIIRKLGAQQPLKNVDLSLYSKLVTTGWF